MLLCRVRTHALRLRLNYFMTLNSFFEKKILFAIGRYFWNLTAVGGFLAVFGGGLIVFDSAVKQQLFEKEVMSLSEWQSGGRLKFSDNYPAYVMEREEFNNIVLQKREASKVLALGGFGLIVASSSMSTFYALERNTRKKED